MTNSSTSTAVRAYSTELASSPNQNIAYASNPHSLAAIWARKYVTAVMTRDDAEKLKINHDISEVSSSQGRSITASKLARNLTLASAQAWSKTEALLSEEVRRHGIDPNLIDPWQIAADSHNLFKKCLDAYSERATPRRLSVMVAKDFGLVRQKYTAEDPRTLGFVSMQFHYTGLSLLEKLSPSEQALFAPYIKVMDDHLYMPLRDAYEAAANYEIGAPTLAAVQQLLPISTKIAHAVCEHVNRLRPGYESYSGSLGSPLVRTSSVRDVEMFQVYLCLCVLENSLRSVQQELFPLCVMLYPRLGVGWELVRGMLQTIGWEMHERLAPDHLAVFFPYLKTLTEMFSVDVFENF